jgi:hypothetical protein
MNPFCVEILSNINAKNFLFLAHGNKQIGHELAE